jgi:hypothetical protein
MQMEQDLAWRNIKKRDDKDQKLEENYNSKAVSD